MARASRILAPAKGMYRRRRDRGAGRNWRPGWDALESRIAPAISSSFASGVLSITSDAADAIVVGSEPTGLVTINGANPGTGPVQASAVLTVDIQGGPGGNRIDLDGVVPSAYSALQGGSIRGGGGVDTLIGPDRTNTWAITEADGGILNGTVVPGNPPTLQGGFTFTAIANLTGGSQPDTMSFQDGSTISGVIDGRAGLLKLTAEDGTFRALGNVLTSGADLSIEALSIELASGVMVSTRAINAGADPRTAPSVGDSGAITLEAPKITLHSGSALLAQVADGQTFSPGAIQLTAEDTAFREVDFATSPHASDDFEQLGLLANLLPFGIFKKQATIAVSGATILGGSITIGAKAADESLSEEVAIPYVDSLVESFFTALNQLPGIAYSSALGISAQVNLRSSNSSITLDGAVIEGDEVELRTDTTANSSLHTVALNRPGSPVSIAVGYGQSVARSRTLITGGSITARQDVTIETAAQSEAEVKARVSANLNADGANIDRNATAFSVAIANTTTEATTTVSATTTIRSTAGNVNVRSKGDVSNVPWAQPMVFRDGVAGIGVGLSFDNSNVTTQVDGTIDAQGVNDLTFDPATAVNLTNSTIRLPDNGLVDGQLVVYSSGDGTAIGGLSDGAAYYVRLVDPDTIQLYQATTLPLDNVGTSAASTQNLNPRAVEAFLPSNVSGGAITIPNHPFTQGQSVVYLANPAGGVGGLSSGNTYWVQVVDANTITLVDATTGQAAPVTAGSATQPQYMQYEQPGPGFNPVNDVDPATGSITIPNHGFQAGEPVVYRVDPDQNGQSPLYAYSQDGQGNLQRTLIADVTVPDVPVRGLTDGVLYFVVVVDANTIQLAADARSAADASAPVQFTSLGTGTDHSLGRTGADQTPGIGVGAELEAENQVTTSVELTGEGLEWSEAVGEFAVNLDYLLPAIKAIPGYVEEFEKWAEGGAEPQVKKTGTKNKFDAAGAFAVNFFTHDVRAEVGASARLSTRGQLAVEAESSNKTQLYVTAKASRPEDSQGSEFSVAVAVGIGLYNNKVEALVDGGARLDARESIEVNADLSYPFLNTDPTFSINPIEFLKDQGPEGWAYFWDGTLGFSDDFFNTWVLSEAEEGEVSAGASVAVVHDDNTATARIGAGARINQNDSPDYRVGPQAVTVDASTGMQLIDLTGLAALNINLGTGIDLLTNLEQLPSKLGKLISPFGVQGEKTGIGASVLLTLATNHTTAEVDRDALVHTGAAAGAGGGGDDEESGLDVQARQDIFSFALAQAGAKASQYAIGASFVLAVFNTTTHASLDSGVQITGGAVDVGATDTLFRTNIAGALLLASGAETVQKAALGVSIAINIMDRDTRAWIGNPADQDPGSNTSIDVDGEVEVSALSTGQLWTFSLAASLSMPTKEEEGGGDEEDDPPSNPNGDPIDDFELINEVGDPEEGQGPDGRINVDIAGDVALDILTDRTYAFINDRGTIRADGLTVDARDTSRIWSVSGALAISTEQEGTSVGIAGSMSSNVTILDTRAFVAGARLDLEGTGPDDETLTLTATRDGFIRSLAAGGSGAPSGEDAEGAQIAGSVSVNLALNETRAYLKDVEATLTNGDARVETTDLSRIAAIAGAFTYGGEVGVGVAIGINLIGVSNRLDLVPNRPGIARAAVEDSSLTFEGSSKGNLSIGVTMGDEGTEPQIIAITAAVGLGLLENQVGIAGLLSINTIATEADAKIAGSTISGATGTATAPAVDISTRDRSRLIATGVALSVSSGSAVGAALGYNAIGVKLTSGVEDSTVTATGGVSLASASEAEIIGVNFGLGISTGTEGVTGSGSAGLNVIKNTTEAIVSQGSSITTTDGTTTLSATDDSTIISVNGAVSGLGEGAIGAAIGYNLIQNTLKAEVDGSTIVATGTGSGQGSIALSAVSRPLLVNIGVGGSGAETFALGGAVGVNSITNEVSARVRDNSTLSADQDVAILATESSTLFSFSGGLGFSSTAAFGAAVAYNYVGSVFDARNPTIDPQTPPPDKPANAVTAAVDGSTVHAKGGTLSVQAGLAPPDSANYPSSFQLGGYTVDLGATKIEDQITAIGVGAAGTDTIAAAGAVLLNIGRNSAESRITGLSATQFVQAGQAIQVGTTDSSTIQSLAGGIALAPSGAAVGAAVSYNDLKNSTVARIGSVSDTDATGANAGFVLAPQVDVMVQSTGTIENLTFAGSGAEDFALAGSISLNILANTLDAHIASSASVSAPNGITIQASDTSTIKSLSGQIDVSFGVGVGIALAYNDIANHLMAYAANSTLTAQSGMAMPSATASVVITATSNPTIETIAVGFAVSSAAIAGSAAINLLSNQVTAMISGSVVTADANVVVLAQLVGKLDPNAGALEITDGLGAGGTAATNVVSNTTRASIEANSRIEARGLGDTVSIPTWDPVTGATGTQPIRGLAVVATASESMQPISLSGSISAGIGIALNLVLNLVGDTTEAFIQDSSVNSATATGQQVVIRAHHDVTATVGGGSLAVGEAALAAMVDTEIFRSSTRAWIADTAAPGTTTVYAGGGIEVTALTRETLASYVGGAAIGLYASLAGAAGVVKSTSTTEAYVADADLTSGSTLVIQANAGLDVQFFTGALSASVLAAAGGAVAVGLLEPQVKAHVDGVNATATGDITVSSTLSETLQVNVGTLAGAGILSLAGSVGFLQSSATVSALVGPGTRGNSTLGSTGGDVSVSATDTMGVTDRLGSLSLGLGVAAGASVDIVQLRNQVTASIAPGSQVTAAGQVEVKSTASRTFDSQVFSFSLGGLGTIDGALTLVSVGVGLSDTQSQQLDGTDGSNQTLADGVNSTISPSGGLQGFNTNSQDKTAATASAAANASLFTISTAANPTASQVYAGIGTGAVVTAGSGGISMNASETATLSASPGSGAASLGASAGASVVLALVGTQVVALVDDGAVLNATGPVSVSAGSTNTLSGDAYGGTGSIGAALGWRVAIIDDASSQSASIGRIQGQQPGTPGARVDQASLVTIAATANRTLSGKGQNVNVSGIEAYGSTSIDVEAAGTTVAAVGQGARMGGQPGIEVRGLVLNAQVQNNQVDSSLDPTSVNASIISANTSNSSLATVSSAAGSSIGAGAQLDITGVVSVNAQAQGDASATTDDSGGSGISNVGNAFALASVRPTVQSAVGDGASITTHGGAITVGASAGPNNSSIGASASVTGSSGSGFNEQTRAQAIAQAASVVTSAVGAATLDAAGQVVTISTAAVNQAHSSGQSSQGSLGGSRQAMDAWALAGASTGVTSRTSNVTGTPDGQSVATLAPGSRVTANGLVIRADSTDYAAATTTISGGGSYGSQDNSAQALATPTVTAGVLDGPAAGAGARIDLTGDLSIAANSSPEADASTNGGGGGVADIGTAVSTVLLQPTVTASVGAHAEITVGGSIQVSTSQGAPITPDSDGSFAPTDPNQLADDTITFRDAQGHAIPHGLQTGSSVLYTSNGNPSLFNLIDNETYNVIATSPTSLRIGNQFAPAQVDLVMDVLNFPNGHNFQPGTQVLYDAGGETPISTTVGPLSSDGSTPYFVRVVDGSNIKLTTSLAAALAPVPTFNPTEIVSYSMPPDTIIISNPRLTNDRFYLSNLGLSANDPVTYNAPPSLAFQVGTAPGSVTILNNTIDLGSQLEHQFLNQQPVTYSLPSGSVGIGGLTPNDTYYVLVIDTHRFQLALPDGSGGFSVVNLDPTSTSGIQALDAVPIQGLTSGQTYYVIDLVQLTGGLQSFRLSATPSGPALSGLSAAGPGNHALAVEGLDFTSPGASTAQDLYVVLNPGQPGQPTTGTHRLIGAGAGGGPPSPSSDGQSSAYATASGGGLVATQGAVGQAAANPVVRVAIGDGAHLHAMGDIQLLSSSAADLGATGAGSGGGLYGEGNQASTASLWHDNQTTIGTGARLNAAGNLTVQASSTNAGATLAASRGVGGVVSAESRARTGFDYTTLTTIAPGAQLTGTTVLVDAETSMVNTNVNASSTGKGLGGDSDANNDGTYGVQVGYGYGNPFAAGGNASGLLSDFGYLNQGFGSVANTITTIGSSSHLTGTQTTIRAMVPLVQGTVVSNSYAGGIGAKNKSRATFAMDDLVQVVIDPDARVTGWQSVLVSAQHQDAQGNAAFNVTTSASADTDALGGDTDVTSDNDIDSTSQVIANAGAVLVSPAPTTQALALVQSYQQLHDRDPAVFDGGGTSLPGRFDAVRDIQFNSDIITALGGSPELVVGSDGTVLIDRGISYDLNTPGVINVHDITNDGSGQVVFLATPQSSFGNVPLSYNTTGPGTISGSQGTFIFQQTFASVEILNASNLDLHINGIEVLGQSVPSDASPAVLINVENDGSGTDFGFQVNYDFAPTLIDIRNTSITATPSIVLNGLIDNPIGATHVFNASGDILQGTSQQVLRTNILELEARLGNGGTSVASLDIELVQSPGRPIVLQADAGKDLNLELTGRLRDPSMNPNQDPWTVPLDSIRSGGQVLVDLNQALLDTLPAPGPGGIVVEEFFVTNPSGSPPFVPGTTFTTVTTQFRPATTPPPPLHITPPGFETGAQPISATYDFGLIVSGADITILGRFVDRVINVHGNTNLGASGLLNATTNGSIDLTETLAALSIGTVLSTASDVTLTTIDRPTPGQDIRLGATGSATASVGSVSLRSGDDVRASADSRIQAGQVLTILGDYMNADPDVGTTIEILGLVLSNPDLTVSAPAVSVQGNTDADLVDLQPQRLVGLTWISTFGADDTITFKQPVEAPLYVPDVLMRIDGGGQLGDNANVLGNAVETSVYAPSGMIVGAGEIEMNGPAGGRASIDFLGLNLVHMASHASLTYLTPGPSNTLLIAASPVAVDRNRVTGTSMPAPQTQALVTFDFDTVPDFMLDARTRSGLLLFSDHLTLDASGWVAAGLQNATIQSGFGHDTLTILTADLRLPVAGGRFLYDGGTGHYVDGTPGSMQRAQISLDHLEVIADVNFRIRDTQDTFQNGQQLPSDVWWESRLEIGRPGDSAFNRGRVDLIGIVSASFVAGDSPSLIDARGYSGNIDAYGGRGNDVLYGGNGNNRLVGGEGDDSLHSGGVQFPDDLEQGGTGSNLLNAYRPDNSISQLHGGGGDDTFHIGPGLGTVFAYDSSGTNTFLVENPPAQLVAPAFGITIQGSGADVLQIRGGGNGQSDSHYLLDPVGNAGQIVNVNDADPTRPSPLIQSIQFSGIARLEDATTVRVLRIQASDLLADPGIRPGPGTDFPAGRLELDVLGQPFIPILVANKASIILYAGGGLPAVQYPPADVPPATQTIPTGLVSPPDAPPPTVALVQRAVPGDHDGDGTSDLVTYTFDIASDRGRFDILPSSSPSTPISLFLGSRGAIPVQGDFDGDGMADVAVVQPETDIDGDGRPDLTRWLYFPSSRPNQAQPEVIDFGAPGTLDRPAPADYDGDGKTDIATFRASSDLTPGAAEWFILGTSAGPYRVVFGAASGVDLPTPADYDGDGRADIATFRPVPHAQDIARGVTDVAQWFVLPSGMNDQTFSARAGAYTVAFGAAGNADQPIPADYDGDGRADIATFRSVSDLPDAMGRADWFFLLSGGSATPGARPVPVAIRLTHGLAYDLASIGDYDGDRRPDIALYRPLDSTWNLRSGLDGAERTLRFGAPGPWTVPVSTPLHFRLRAVDPRLYDRVLAELFGEDPDS